MKNKATDAKMTAATVHEFLQKIYPAQDYVYLREVRSQRGFSNNISFADALVIPLWPSRGHYLHGIEIKVSRSDWLHELKSASKSSAIIKHCATWTLATPDGIVEDGELPPGWGHIIVGGAKNKHISKPRHRDGAEEVPPLIMSLIANMAKSKSKAIRDEVNEKLKTERQEYYNENSFATGRDDGTKRTVESISLKRNSNEGEP